MTVEMLPGCAGTDGNAEGWFGRGGGIWNTGFYFWKKWVVYDGFDGGGGKGIKCKKGTDIV